MGKESAGTTVAAMKSRGAEEEEQLLLFRKRRKFYSESGNEHEELVENFASPAASRTSGCCKDDESDGVVGRGLRAVPDLEILEMKLGGFERENPTSMVGGLSREGTPTSELCGDSDEVLMDSVVAGMPSKKLPSMPRRKSSPSCAEKMPSEAELDEFFTAAEKYEHKRFAEKYNYDIVKDVPLEGKYQWVRLQP